MQISVVGGAGYVGITQGVGLAHLGHTVVGYDRDSARVEMLGRGEPPIHEEGLPELLKENLDSGRLSFTTDPVGAIPGSEIVFVAVDTPAMEDGNADLSRILEVSEDLAAHMSEYTVVAIKSTVPVGTVDALRNVLTERRREGQDFDLVSNPEFLREGKALYDFFNPDRIVIGSESERAVSIVRESYAPLISRAVTWPDREGADERGPVPVVETSIPAAQTMKYAANAFLATRISFINEIAGICERVGADVGEVAYGLGLDPRIGSSYLNAGIGFGGPCLEKDLLALVHAAETTGYEPHLLKAVLTRNDRQIDEVVSKITEALGGFIYRKTVALFGLSFKAGTNDVRNSLAPRVMERLIRQGATVRAHDPVAVPEAAALWPDVEYFDDPYEAVKGADAMLVLTEWPEFRELDFGRIHSSMRSHNVIDARNLLDRDKLRQAGFDYRGVGRG